MNYLSLVNSSLIEALKKLSPFHQTESNLVMKVTYLGAVFTTGYAIFYSRDPFDIHISVWLWLTVLFANFAEAFAEHRGKAQASHLRKHQDQLTAKKLSPSGEIQKIPAFEIKKEDIVLCEAGDFIPADGEVVEGVGSVDESAITGESAPVIRESGGDRSAVTMGTRVVSDQLKIKVTAEVGDSFLDRMIGLIEGASRQKTPNEIALNVLLTGLTLLFIFCVITLKIFADFSATSTGEDLSSIISLPVLVALLVCLIPTTIGALLSAVGIAGMDRLIQRNVIAKSGKSVEAAGDIDLLILDKTGTITLGNRVAVEFIPNHGISAKELAEAAQLASLADETPEGRSIVVLAKSAFGLRAEHLDPSFSNFIPFSAQTRMSGVDLLNANREVVKKIRKGAVDAIAHLTGPIPPFLEKHIDHVASQGGTPLLVSEDKKLLGLVYLKDVIKGGIKERFAEMRKIGIRTIMVTGDNPLTAAAIAAEAGVDDFIAEATPEMKLERIREEQRQGHLVAMTGDGTNDAPALAQADVGVAMNTGTQASREAGNMVDLDSNPTKLLEIIQIGKQLLMTRGSLTTFSIANDVAKYFAIIPALFSALYKAEGAIAGPLSQLNIMSLASPQSAILSAVIYNALIIILLIPLAMKGVDYHLKSARLVLKQNLLYYGLGGIIVPFIGIKLIDLCLTFFGAGR